MKLNETQNDIQIAFKRLRGWWEYACEVKEGYFGDDPIKKFIERGGNMLFSPIETTATPFIKIDGYRFWRKRFEADKIIEEKLEEPHHWKATGFFYLTTDELAFVYETDKPESEEGTTKDIITIKNPLDPIHHGTFYHDKGGGQAVNGKVRLRKMDNENEELIWQLVELRTK